jgi:hypothetical protein
MSNRYDRISKYERADEKVLNYLRIRFIENRMPDDYVPELINVCKTNKQSREILTMILELEDITDEQRFMIEEEILTYV